MSINFMGTFHANFIGKLHLQAFVHTSYGSDPGAGKMACQIKVTRYLCC